MSKTKDPDSYHYMVKVAVIGDSDVGKTQLLQAEDHIEPNFVLTGFGLKTIGNSKPESKALPKARLNSGSTFIQFKNRDYTLKDQIYRIQYWDCPGSERYIELTSKYCAGCAGILLVFDLTRETSFDMIPKWLKLVNEINPSAIKILVGNKDNSLAAPRQVSRSTAEFFASNNGMAYYETDALSLIRTEAVFQDMFLQIVESIPSPPDPKLLVNSGVKIGAALLADKRYRDALQSHAQDSASKQKLSFAMDWL